MEIINTIAYQKADLAQDSIISEIGSYRFEVVKGFIYLGSEINAQNNISTEVHNKIAAANECYFFFFYKKINRLISLKEQLN